MAKPLEVGGSQWGNGFIPKVNVDGPGPVVSPGSSQPPPGEAESSPVRRPGSQVDLHTVVARPMPSVQPEGPSGVIAMSTSGDASARTGDTSPAAMPATQPGREVQLHQENQVQADRRASFVSAKDTGRVRQPWDGRQENGEAEERVPLVVDIRDFGDERSEKVEVIARASSILRFLKVNENLVKEIEAAEETTESLGFQVLKRKPIEEERVYIQGRGITYEDVPIGDDIKADVYVKGSGASRTFKGKDAIFPGFPAEDEELFFDDPHVYHPRIPGADYIPVALLELMDSCEEFAKKAKKGGWTSKKQALEAGSTIPLSVTLFKELSEHLKARVDQAREETDDEWIKRALDWDASYFGVGSITQIVPTKDRVTKGVFTAKELEDAAFQVQRPSIYAVVGKAMHEHFAAAGGVPEPESGHLQNVYREGAALADAADRIFLSDYEGKRVTGHRGREVVIPPETQRTLLLFKLFTNDKLLIPIHFPRPDERPERNINLDKVVAMHKRFWGEMLNGYAHPDASLRIAQLMPVMRTELALAISSVLVEEHAKQDWSEMRATRQALFDQFAQYHVREEYDRMLEHSIEDEELSSLAEVMGNDRLPVAGLVDMLRTGNIADAAERDRYEDRETDRFGEGYSLMHEVYNMRPVDWRDEVANLIGNYYGYRDIKRLALQPDQIAAMEGLVSIVLKKYIKARRYSDVKQILNILIGSQKEGFRDAYRPDGAPEPSEFHYGAKLVFADPMKPEVLEGIALEYNYDKGLFKFAHDAKPLSAGESSDGKKAGGTVLFDASSQKLPSPEKVIRAILGGHNVEIGDTRNEVATWLNGYFEVMNEQFLPGNGRESARQTLDAHAESVRDTYPELAFGHACIMADKYSDSDAALAESYRQQALDYYQSQMQGRLRESGVAYILKEPSEGKRRGQYAVLARKYKNAGLWLLEGVYTKLAKGKIQKIGW